ncbi:MAG: serine/threonine protein kinase [Nostoc sp.]|uniref:serine/threonine protein kinase n=1 Tax=Nostoc sp. TaxID=1180 RepID=UPI002FF4D465
MKTKKTDEHTSTGREVFYYQVYGLTLRTNQPLSDLSPLSDVTDVDAISIHLARTWEESAMPVPSSAWQPSLKHSRLQTATLEEGTYLLLSFIEDEQAYAEFVINPSGENIWITVGEGADQRFVTWLLLGIVLGCVLRIRGITCLHANVVTVGQKAIAILGAKGAGKSTITAALLQRGAKLLADDVAVLVEQNNTFFVQPGYPGLRLHEDVATQLYGSYKHLQSATPKPDLWPTKRYLSLVERQELFSQTLFPLTAIYILGDRSSDRQSVSIETLSSVTGLLDLMQNTYVSWMLSKTDMKNEFRVLSCLARTVPLRKIHRPNNLAKLPQLCEAILADANSYLLNLSLI